MNTQRDYEQEGYDAFIDIWCREGCKPRAMQCPGLYQFAEGSDERRDYLRGWAKARDEA